MRPTLDQPEAEEESGRIIYLGDVRRRRVIRKRAPQREQLGLLAVTACASFGVWLAVVVTLPPAKLLTYVAFFAPLWLTVAAASTLGVYWFEWRQGIVTDLRGPARRGILVATLLLVNLGAVAAQYWSWPVGALSLLAAVLIDRGIASKDRA